MSHSQHNTPWLIKELSEKLKEPLDTIELLQKMEILSEKPPLPMIIVLGESGACAASVIGTLVGLNLPSGLEIPLLLKFTIDSAPSRKIVLEFPFECTHFKKEVREDLIASEIEELVKHTPKNERSNIEVTLTVIQPHVSDLTVVLLPEVKKQYPEPSLITENVYTYMENMNKQRKVIELFKGYIHRYQSDSYVTCLFLHVLLRPSNIDSCLSRKIRDEFHCLPRHLVTVFTKLDQCSTYRIQCLNLENKSETSFRYFFVDNTTSEDGEKTREHDLLSEVDKDYIGFDVISKHLVTTMLSILFHPWSFIPQRIESDLQKCGTEIKECRKTFDSLSDAVPLILRILSSVSMRLHQLFITQDDVEYRKVKHMRAAFNIRQRFKMFRIDLQDLKLDNQAPFLQYEIELLSKSWLNLTSFGTSSFIKPLLSRQFSNASITIDTFVTSIIDYIREVVIQVLLDHAKKYLELHESLKKAGGVLVEGVKNSYTKNVEEMLDLEKKCFNTCSNDINTKVNEMKSLKLDLSDGKSFTSIEGLGENIKVDHLKRYSADQIERAFEMRKTVAVYWEFVVNRFVDNCALYLQSSIKEMMDVGIPGLIEENLMKCIKDKSKLPDVEDILAIKRAKLERRIKYLTKAKKDIKKWQVEVDYFL